MSGDDFDIDILEGDDGFDTCYVDAVLDFWEDCEVVINIGNPDDDIEVQISNEDKEFDDDDDD